MLVENNFIKDICFFSRFALRENKGLVRFLAGKYMSDKLMMTIARTINDVVLVVLKNPEILEPIGISQEKFFTKVLGYDETGIWVQFPDFELPSRVGQDAGIWVPESMQEVNASAMIPWGAIATVMHFPDVKGYDFPSPFNRDIGFNHQGEGS